MKLIEVSKMVARVAKFLIQHKFFERDQRLTNKQLASQKPVCSFAASDTLTINLICQFVHL